MLSETEWGTEQLKLAVLAARETLPDVQIAGQLIGICTAGSFLREVRDAGCTRCCRTFTLQFAWQGLGLLLSAGLLQQHLPAAVAHARRSG